MRKLNPALVDNMQRLKTLDYPPQDSLVYSDSVVEDHNGNLSTIVTVQRHVPDDTLTPADFELSTIMLTGNYSMLIDTKPISKGILSTSDSVSSQLADAVYTDRVNASSEPDFVPSEPVPSEPVLN